MEKVKQGFFAREAGRANLHLFLRLGLAVLVYVWMIFTLWPVISFVIATPERFKPVNGWEKKVVPGKIYSVYAEDLQSTGIGYGFTLFKGQMRMSGAVLEISTQKFLNKFLVFSAYEDRHQAFIKGSFLPFPNSLVYNFLAEEDENFDSTVFYPVYFQESTDGGSLAFSNLIVLGIATLGLGWLGFLTIQRTITLNRHPNRLSLQFYGGEACIAEIDQDFEGEPSSPFNFDSIEGDHWIVDRRWGRSVFKKKAAAPKA